MHPDDYSTPQAKRSETRAWRNHYSRITPQIGLLARYNLARLKPILTFAAWLEWRALRQLESRNCPWSFKKVGKVDSEVLRGVPWMAVQAFGLHAERMNESSRSNSNSYGLRAHFTRKSRVFLAPPPLTPQQTYPVPGISEDHYHKSAVQRFSRCFLLKPMLVPGQLVLYLIVSRHTRCETSFEWSSILEKSAGQCVRIDERFAQSFASSFSARKMCQKHARQQSQSYLFAAAEHAQAAIP